jgi:hypothetical protein
MKRAKTIEAVLSLLAISAMVLFGWAVNAQSVVPSGYLPLCDFAKSGQPCQDAFEGGGFGGGGGGLAKGLIAPPADLCGGGCWLFLGWLAERGWEYASGVMQRNSCDGACSGGGGGGFECAPDDRACNTMNTW